MPVKIIIPGIPISGIKELQKFFEVEKKNEKRILSASKKKELIHERNPF